MSTAIKAIGMSQCPSRMSQKKNILIVCEKDPMGDFLTDAISEHMTAKVNIVEISSDAAQLHRELTAGGPYDLLILTNNGFLPSNIPATLSRIKLDHPSMPVIVMASSNNTSFIEDLFRRGANNYITFPLVLDYFIRQVESSLFLCTQEKEGRKRGRF